MKAKSRANIKYRFFGISSAVFICLNVLFFSSLVFADAEADDKPPMDHMGHGAPADPGQEYRVDSPEKGGHQHSHRSPEEGESLFRTRGQHDAMTMKQPEQDPGTLMARGRNIYLHMCVFCHGEDGNGGGIAVEYLYPWPRDFRKGIFKFRSTPTGTLPRDEDLYRTIIKGVPGTSMPAWEAAVSPEDTWALINLIKNFSPRFKNETPGEKIKIGEPPAATPEVISKGKELFTSLKCVNCHGASGKGDGKLADSLMDAWKHSVFVHDITNPAFFKGGYSENEIFQTLSTGLDGTPMQAYSHLPEEDRWALVRFIQSRFTEEILDAEFETDVYSHPVEYELNTEVNSPLWKDIKGTELVLRPLSARREAVNTINISSVHNGEQLAIRLRWKDPTQDAFSTKRQDVFRDGAAVQFAIGAATLHTHGHNEPFFGMGNRNKPVNIWHWKAGLEETLEAESDLEYSTGGVDMDALIFGGISSNPVARLNPTSENSVEELNAEGFGTITPQPPENQNVEGYGEWKDGIWTVVFLRDMPKTGKWDVDLTKKEPLLVALAVWDGVREDRNGRKVVSVWQRFNLLGK
jgi:mono/diheme cytochrome c family protein